jgi:SAM-dependent methyltransferase
MAELKYDFDVDAADESTSHGVMINLVGHGKRVLDVGCATGYLARTLSERGNSVAGIEGNPEAAAQARQFADPVVVGDLDDATTFGQLESGTFDVLVFGDVLEHLRDPLTTLRAARSLLRPGGFIVVSVPNIAHGDVRLALLQGNWDYQQLGLLDDTHLRFFTRRSLQKFLAFSGFVAVEVRNTTVPLFGTELGVVPEDFDQALLARIEQDPDATTYQFVFRAVPDDAVHYGADLAFELKDVKDALERMTREAAESKAAVIANARSREELQQLLDGSQAEAAALKRELNAERERALAAEGALARLEATRLIRGTAPLREAYGWLRRRTGVSPR